MSFKNSPNCLEDTAPAHVVLSALSLWLPGCSTTPQTIDPASVALLPAAPHPIPMVYSHEHWFDTSIGPVCAEIDRELDAQHCYNPARLCCLLRMANELIRRVAVQFCPRERMSDFMAPFSQLLRCAEKPLENEIRKLAQQAFLALVERFEPVAQFLLTSRLFELIFRRSVVLSEEVHEPQLLAFVVDTFRQKCFSPTSGIECKRIFQTQLGYFYSQLDEVAYEDPLVSINFYTAVLLLVSAQAIHRVHLALLKSTGQPFIRKFRRQIRDWTDLQRKKDEQNESMGMVEKMQKQQKEQMDRQSIEMFAFQIDDAQKRVDCALGQC